MSWRKLQVLRYCICVCPLHQYTNSTDAVPQELYRLVIHHGSFLQCSRPPSPRVKNLPLDSYFIIHYTPLLSSKPGQGSQHSQEPPQQLPVDVFVQQPSPPEFPTGLWDSSHTGCHPEDKLDHAYECGDNGDPRDP